MNTESKVDLPLGGAFDKPVPTNGTETDEVQTSQPVPVAAEDRQARETRRKSRAQRPFSKSRQPARAANKQTVSRTRIAIVVISVVLILVAAFTLSLALVLLVLVAGSAVIVLALSTGKVRLPKIRPHPQAPRQGRSTASKGAKSEKTEEPVKQPVASRAKVPPTKGFPALRYKLYSVLKRPQWVPQPNQAEKRELDYQRSKKRLFSLSDQVPTLTVAYFGVKGLAATTATTVHTASILAEETRIPVDVSDFNPAQGSSAVRLGRDHGQTITLRGLLAELEKLSSHSEFKSRLRPTRYGVRVVSADSIVKPHQHLTGGDATRMLVAISKNSEYHHIDTPNDITTDVSLAVAEAADVFVFTANVAVRDSLRMLATGMETFREHGFGDKVNHSVVVISNIPKGKSLDDYRHYLNEVDINHQVVREIPFGGAIVGVPHDPIIALDGEVDLSKLRPETRLSYLQLNNTILEQALNASVAAPPTAAVPAM